MVINSKRYYIYRIQGDTFRARFVRGGEGLNCCDVTERINWN